MNSFIDFIDNLLVTINNSINEKIFGTGYLENIKFQLIEKLILLDDNIIKDLKSELLTKRTFSKKHNLNNRSLNYNINYFQDSVSNIKHNIEKETLNIVLEGLRTILIFDNKKNKSAEINITKNMGIVIGQNTIISEITNKKSIILTITNE